MGADQLLPGAAIGPLAVALDTGFTNLTVGFAASFQARVEGQTTGNRWAFGDGTQLTNVMEAVHAWQVPGRYAVQLTAFNDAQPGGVTATVVVEVVAVPVFYVNQANASPASPYASWATAATNIQEAIGAGSVAGRVVLVTNGVYDTGGIAVWGLMTNRIALTNGVVVRSLNGPSVTFIRGAPAPGTTNGDGAIRCAYVGAGSLLDGFTLTNGHTRASGHTSREQGGGGAWCEQTGAVTNCTFVGNEAFRDGGGANGGNFYACTFVDNRAGNDSGGADDAVLYDCMVIGNRADSRGGGASESTLNNCMLTNNTAYGGHGGGGAYESTLNHCTLTGNSAASGGGASMSTLHDCILTNNAAFRGGGAYYATLNNCTLTANSAANGGGAYFGTLNNCALAGNSATNGGGAHSATLNNCTLTGNSATNGGGAYSGTLNNSILYYNTAANGPNYSSDTLNYCCTTPMPRTGTGNLTAEPQFASAWHLSLASPCRGAGNATYASGTDIDGEPWLNPPSVGCDEYWAGAITGAVTVAIGVTLTNVTAGVPVDLTGWISGRVAASFWDFGDGTVLSNRFFTTHTWAAAGDYTVVLRAYNESHPEGVSAATTIRVDANVHYVSVASANPLPPYTSWATAARTIQAVVDATMTLPGALIWVTNGVYDTGGRAVVGAMTNRVAVTKPVVVRSVNGPQETVIQGYQVPGSISGNGAIRCVYLASGAVLSGFTLTHGATRTLGNVSPEQSGGGVWCESINALVTNCTLTGNQANINGGGASSGTLNNCTLAGNSAENGGGASSATLNNCTLTGNSASSGGAAYAGTLNNCALTGNSAENGGASYAGTLNNCTLTGNRATSGGGASSGTLNNCVLYNNTANNGPNYLSGTLNYCCTTPMPGSGTGNLSADPQLASASHLGATSPCRQAGNPTYATGADIDGEPWLSPPSIGCDEYRAGAVTGSLTVAIRVSLTEVAAGYAVDLTGLITGRVAASVWDFGDGTGANNRPYANHAWLTPGEYTVALRAYNESHPEAVSATVLIRVRAQPVHHVWAASANPVPPYTNWQTGASTIQAAVDAATVPGALIWVTNGIYDTGGRAVAGAMTNRVAVTKPVVVRSVNGPQATVIQGHQVPGTVYGDAAIRCVYLANGAVLSGFTLAQGATRTLGDLNAEESGGGVWCESVNASITNCTLTGNRSFFCGGGVFSGTLNNCTLTDNDTYDYGGGAYGSTLNNCTLTGNAAHYYGGGAYGGMLYNCILYYNTANLGFNYFSNTLNYCCTTPDPGGGAGNLTAEPLFADRLNGNLRLLAHSPCINAGADASVPGTTDLDGRPRIVGGTVDMGAYEYQGPGFSQFIPWLAQSGLPTDGSADTADPDADELNNWQEWRCGTDPTNALSVLRLLSPETMGADLVVRWASVSNRVYYLERTTNLAALPPFQLLATNLTGQDGVTTFLDTKAAGAPRRFYRVGVNVP
jgi:PKD repeat protein